MNYIQFAVDKQLQSPPLNPTKRRLSIFSIYEKMLTKIEPKKTRRSKRGGKRIKQ